MDALYFHLSLGRLNNLPFNVVKLNFVAIVVFFVIAVLFIEMAKREAILFLFGCSEVNSTWLIASKLANQRVRKTLLTSVVHTNC